MTRRWHSASGRRCGVRAIAVFPLFKAIRQSRRNDSSGSTVRSRRGWRQRRSTILTVEVEAGVVHCGFGGARAPQRPRPMLCPGHSWSSSDDQDLVGPCLW